MAKVYTKDLLRKKSTLLGRFFAFSCLFCLFCFQVNAQSVDILEESFRDGSLPAGWTAEEIDFRTGAGGYALFEETTSTLTSPVLDLTAYSNVELEFDVAKFGGGANGPITVQVSDDGGTTWTAQQFDSPIPTGSTYMTSGPTPINVTGDNVKIRFIRENSPSGKRLRDMTLTGDGPPPPQEVTIIEPTYIDDFSTNPFNSGWSDQNITGDQEWEYGANFNNVSMSAFDGGCQVNENWLVSPGFDLTDTENEQLSFDVARGFPGDNDLEVLYSTDYSGLGDPNDATWTAITSISSGDFSSNNSEQTFGDFDDLQGISDTVFVAFKFEYETGDCATWRVAGFSLIASEAPPALTAIDAPYDQDFEDFVSFETLPAGWDVSNTSYNGDWGSGTAGGLRGNDNVLGFQHTGGTGTFTTTLTLINETGGPIEQLEVEYTGKIERATQNRSPEWTVRVNGVVVPDLFYSTAGGVDEDITAIIGGIFIPEGENVVIEWSSDRGFDAPSGSSKQIGISDVSVTALEAPALVQPSLSEQADTYFEDLLVFVTNFDGYSPVVEVRYTQDGTDPDTDSPLYDDNDGILVEDGNGAVNLRVRAFNTVSGEESAVTSVDYVFPVNIVDIATLRDQPTGSTLYRLANEATFIGGTNFRNTKFFQDDSGFGIQIDDAPSGIFNPGVISTQYEIGDNVSGIVGTLGVFQGQLQLVAELDPGPAVSSGNVIEPMDRTLDELTADDQSRLVRVKDVEFVNTGDFGGGGSSYAITDPSVSGFGLFRNIFGDSDITGSPIPELPVTIVGIIQENNNGLNLGARGLFDFTERRKISGIVADVFGDPVEDVELEMTLPENANFTTGPDGYYEFFFDLNDNLLITGSKEDDPARLVSTMDLIAIQQHIIGLNPFDSPYKIIASDANDDGVVSTFDLVILQTLIVGLIDEFDSPIWRFVPAGYDFDDPSNPFGENFPEYFAKQGVTELLDEDWVAIKTGDVVNTNNIRMGNEVLAVNVHSETNKSGQTEFVFTSGSDYQIEGYQMTLDLPPQMGQIHFVPGELMTGMTEINFNVIDNTARTNYINGKGIELQEGMELFRIQMTSDGTVEASDIAIAIHGGLKPEAYPVGGGKMRVILDSALPGGQKDWSVNGLSPVPTSDMLHLELKNSSPGQRKVEIFNSSGQLIKHFSYESEVGVDNRTMDVRNLQSGHYFIRVMSSEHTEVIPFVKID
ncbi:MAG: T9SS C-terminal target domain-containing protein [Saprospirales bacterium]|nr:MAG: T9SS C-terminal target domain-containing protein [Saprospirales bacterium]